LHTYYRDGRQKTETSVSRNALPTPAPTSSYSYANTVPSDPLGALRVTRTDPFNKTQITDSDLLGRVIGVMDENHTGDPVEEHHKTKYVYDSMGRKVGQILPPEQDLSNHTYTTYAYDQAGHLRVVTDETMGSLKKLRMKYQYDDLGRQTLREARDSDINVLLETASTSYLGDEISTSTDGRGIVTTYSYDYTSIPGAKIETTRVGGNKIATKLFNSFGELTLERDRQHGTVGRDTTYTYDNDGRVTKLTGPDPDGAGPLLASETSYAYDQAGNLLTQTDPLMHVTTYTYDAQNRKTRAKLPEPFAGAAQPTTTYSYTGGVLTSTTDPSGNAFTYTYDALDRINTESTRVWLNPNAPSVVVTTATEYDAAGNVSKITDADGKVRMFIYDNLNRKSYESWYATATAPAWEEQLSFEYDQQSRLLGINSAGGSVIRSSYKYDALGRVTTQDDDHVAIESSYDLAGNRVQTEMRAKDAFQESTITNYAYDDQNRLAKILQTSGQGNSAVMKGLDFSYELSGEMTQSRRYNGGSAAVQNDGQYSITLTSPMGAAGTQSYRYDNAGRVTAIGFGNESGTTYAYDAADRITNMTVFGVSRNYTYDNEDQLKQSSGSGASGDYSYDVNGNRTSNNSQIGAGNRLKSDGKWNYEYDKNGNLIVKTNFAGATPTNLGQVRVNYTYDQRNELTEAETLTYLNGQSHTQREQYNYSGEGRLMLRTDYDEGGVHYAYDGDNAVLEYGNIAITRSLYYGLATDQILEQDTHQKAWWLMTDHQGSVRRELKTNGSVARRIDYDEFGNILGDKGTGPSPVNKFDGMRWDDKINAYLDRARIYGPDLGRFYQQDPLQSTANAYVFVGNDPLNFTDPDGMEAFGTKEWAGNSHLISSNVLDQLLGINRPVVAARQSQTPTYQQAEHARIQGDVRLWNEQDRFNSDVSIAETQYQIDSSSRWMADYEASQYGSNIAALRQMDAIERGLRWSSNAISTPFNNLASELERMSVNSESSLLGAAGGWYAQGLRTLGGIVNIPGRAVSVLDDLEGYHNAGVGGYHATVLTLARALPFVSALPKFYDAYQGQSTGGSDLGRPLSRIERATLVSSATSDVAFAGSSLFLFRKARVRALQAESRGFQVVTVENASKINRNAFRTAREAFWMAEAESNPVKYSAADLMKMKQGRPPTGPDGYPIELHHVDRTPEGGVTPMSRTDHRLGNNYKKNHP
jgi:RHS repeat-associated protein